MPLIRPTAVLLLVTLAAPTLALADTRPQVRTYPARDTARIDPASEPEGPARAMLGELTFEPAEFDVRVSAPVATDRAPVGAEAIVRFPSPKPDPERDALFNTVHVEWYPAASVAGAATQRKAPAILLLHALDGRMPITRAMARRFADAGVHAFVMHQPGFGVRRIDRFNAADFLAHAAQSVTDARRARDAIAALPAVDGERIALGGVSLGGFMTAIAGALDGAFSDVFIVLAGGDLHHLFTNGAREAAMIRQHLAEAGYTGAKLAEVCARLEPTSIAHRLPRGRTWMFTAAADQVVPRHCADVLAAAADLAATHHQILWGDHYLGVVHLPWLTDRMLALIRE